MTGPPGGREGFQRLVERRDPELPRELGEALAPGVKGHTTFCAIQHIRAGQISAVLDALHGK